MYIAESLYAFALFDYISMHSLLKIITKIYSELIVIPKGAGYIIHDRRVATLGHVTLGTTHLKA